MHPVRTSTATIRVQQKPTIKPPITKKIKPFNVNILYARISSWGIKCTENLVNEVLLVCYCGRINNVSFGFDKKLVATKPPINRKRNEK